MERPYSRMRAARKVTAARKSDERAIRTAPAGWSAQRLAAAFPPGMRMLICMLGLPWLAASPRSGGGPAELATPLRPPPLRDSSEPLPLLLRGSSEPLPPPLRGSSEPLPLPSWDADPPPRSPSRPHPSQPRSSAERVRGRRLFDWFRFRDRTRNENGKC